MRKRLLPIPVLLLVLAPVIAAQTTLLHPRMNPRPGPVAGTDETDDVFFLQRFIGPSAYYLGSGSLDDTICVVFEPIAQCSILYAQLQWNTPGSYQSFLWDYSEAAEAMYPDGRAVDRGASPVSPLGDIVFGPFDTTCIGSQDFEDLFTSDDLPGGGVEWGDSLFVVGFVKTQDDGLPQPLAADVPDGYFSYTWFGGPWNQNYDFPWGGYCFMESCIDGWPGDFSPGFHKGFLDERLLLQEPETVFPGGGNKDRRAVPLTARRSHCGGRFSFYFTSASWSS